MGGLTWAVNNRGRSVNNRGRLIWVSRLISGHFGSRYTIQCTGGTVVLPAGSARWMSKLAQHELPQPLSEQEFIGLMFAEVSREMDETRDVACPGMLSALPTSCGNAAYWVY